MLKNTEPKTRTIIHLACQILEKSIYVKEDPSPARKWVVLTHEEKMENLTATIEESTSFNCREDLEEMDAPHTSNHKSNMYIQLIPPTWVGMAWKNPPLMPMS